jgi:hypothetical protein
VAASMIGASLVLPALLEAIRRLREPR